MTKRRPKFEAMNFVPSFWFHTGEGTPRLREQVFTLCERLQEGFIADMQRTLGPPWNNAVMTSMMTRLMMTPPASPAPSASVRSCCGSSPQNFQRLFPVFPAI